MLFIAAVQACHKGRQRAILEGLDHAADGLGKQRFNDRL